MDITQMLPASRTFYSWPCHLGNESSPSPAHAARPGNTGLQTQAAAWAVLGLTGAPKNRSSIGCSQGVAQEAKSVLFLLLLDSQRS